jgi:hypothetical protein
MPNRSIEIHDSILASVSISQGNAELHFSSVYIHQSLGVPGRDAGSGWVQRAILRIYNAEMKAEFSQFPVDLGDGLTQMGDDRLSNEIPVPLRYQGTFQLLLQAKWQAQEISFTGNGAELELIGEPEYVEEFRPKDLS